LTKTRIPRKLTKVKIKNIDEERKSKKYTKKNASKNKAATEESKRSKAVKRSRDDSEDVAEDVKDADSKSLTSNKRGRCKN
jgi:hypothetical protein